MYLIGVLVQDRNASHVENDYDNDNDNDNEIQHAICR